MGTSTRHIECMLFVVLCPGAPEGSAGSGSGLKRLRRWDLILRAGAFADPESFVRGGPILITFLCNTSRSGPSSSR